MITYSIDIPYGLNLRLNKYKDAISPSNIFIQAVTKVCDAIEDAQKRVTCDNWKSAINRLKEEKKLEVEKYFERGKDAGDIFLKTASLNDIKDAVNISSIYFLSCPCEINLINDDLSRYLYKFKEIKKIDGEAYKEWLKGWVYEVANMGKELLAQV